MAITVLSINEAGHESGLDGMADRGDLALLQDEGDPLVWDTWDPTYRDVIILDDENVEVARYNLTTYSLGVEENYNALRDLLISAASE